MFFIVIPKCLLINGELEGYIYINNKKLMINNYSFFINGYLFYQINEDYKNDISYYIYNYNQIRQYNNFHNIIKTTNNKENIFSNNIITIKQNKMNPYSILIKANEQIYEHTKLYFNTNKEFIIESEYIYIPAFEILHELYMELFY